MPESLDDILDDLFLGCALAAYLAQAALAGGPPDSAATRRRAYQLYEAALAARHQPGPSSDQLIPFGPAR